MCKNWLLIGWAFAKIVYLLAEHREKSFGRTMCIFRVFLSSSCPCLTSFVPSRTSLYFVSIPMSPVLRLCSLSPFLGPLSHLSVSCLPYASPILRLCSLYLVRYALSHSSAPCPPSSVPCLMWSFPCLPSSFLCPLTPITLCQCPIFCDSIPLFLFFARICTYKVAHNGFELSMNGWTL